MTQRLASRFLVGGIALVAALFVAPRHAWAQG
jgi:hypothetical protein